MGSCNSINVAAAAAAQKLAAMNPENQRKAERERQKRQEEDEQNERQRVYCQEKADEQMNEYTERMNEEPHEFSSPKVQWNRTNRHCIMRCLASPNGRPKDLDDS